MTIPFNAAIVYIDESGDLGFNFSRQGTSKYLILTALACKDGQTSQSIIHAVKKVRHHENKRSKKANLSELKGAKTKFELKCYFFKQLNAIQGWQLFTITARKQHWINLNTSNASPEIFYDALLIKLLQAIPLKQNATIIIDRSKSQKDIDILNTHIEKIFSKSSNKLIINHDHSYAHAGLQSVDLFSWGIARKYEKNDSEWYNIFKRRIALELKA